MEKMESAEPELVHDGEGSEAQHAEPKAPEEDEIPLQEFLKNDAELQGERYEALEDNEAGYEFIREDEGNQSASAVNPNEGEDMQDEGPVNEEQTDVNVNHDVKENGEVEFIRFTGKKREFSELRQKRNQVGIASPTGMVAEKKRIEGPQESRGISEQRGRKTLAIYSGKRTNGRAKV
ncbi:hypothetical protein POM88_036438 [Heracleum sosnowskyi]|uniref:Uncharacterized protein n=1 Tax=Heracleum sosnowskyi TaxID=360622 RepID=A0AAD8HPA8_9APIA|nr:hypothetical protein POM88_036438 [Heracleum sosnowskyi]